MGAPPPQQVLMPFYVKNIIFLSAANSLLSATVPFPLLLTYVIA